MIQECLSPVRSETYPGEPKFTVYMDEDEDAFFLTADGVRSYGIAPLTAGEVLELLADKLDGLSKYESLIINKFTE